jgi:hypothetical protein
MLNIDERIPTKAIEEMCNGDASGYPDDYHDRARTIEPRPPDLARLAHWSNQGLSSRRRSR